MQIHQLSAADAIASLNRSPQGLSSVEAMRRLSEYGLNRVEEVARESILLRFLKEFTHFFALILWLAAGLAFVAEWSDPGHGMAKVGYAILAVIVVSGLFSFWQEFRVERTLAALRGCFRSKSMCSAMARRSGCSLNDSSRATLSCWSEGTTFRRIVVWSRPSEFALTMRRLRGNRFQASHRRALRA